MTYIGNRGDGFTDRHLRPNFELGRSKFSFYSSRDRQSMADVIADADIVINLVGKYYATRALENIPKFPYLNYKINTSLAEANIDVPKTIAELCTEMQVDNLIHVSSAAASPDSASEWARTKYAGEQAVLEAFPWATIVRPTQLFGHEDKLLNYFARMAERFPVIPLVDGGHALTQPVWADDVARTINRIVDDPETFEGRRVDCFGPQDYSYAELARFVYDITGQDPTLSDIPAEVTKYAGNLLQFEGNPMITPDLIDLWSEDYLPEMTNDEYDAQSSKDKVFTMKDLGVASTPIEKVAFKYLHRFRTGGHFILAEGYHWALFRELMDCWSRLKLRLKWAGGELLCVGMMQIHVFKIEWTGLVWKKGVVLSRLLAGWENNNAVITRGSREKMRGRNIILSWMYN